MSAAMSITIPARRTAEISTLGPVQLTGRNYSGVGGRARQRRASTRDVDAAATGTGSGRVRSHSQVPSQERNAALAPERMFGREDFLLDAIRGAEHAVDFLDFVEARHARLNRKDVVFLTGLHEQRTRSNQAGDVVHL